MERYNSRLRNPAKELRRLPTASEQRLWQALRGKQICGITFYRQKPLLFSIVDFYGPKAKLVIELDGGYHEEPEQQAKDMERDALLSSLGLRVLRFSNDEIFFSLPDVLERITTEIMRRCPLPSEE